MSITFSWLNLRVKKFFKLLTRLSNLVKIFISLSVLWQYVWCSKGLIFFIAT